MTDVVTGSGNGSTQGYWPFIGHFELLLLNKFFDPSTPSMRNIEHLQNPKWPPGRLKMAGDQGAGDWPFRATFA